MGQKIQYCYDSLCPKLICKFNSTPSKILAIIFAEIDNGL